MTIEELSIGDWVVLENQPFKVIGINPPYVDLLGNGNRLRLSDIDNDNLSPIPLTPEILEKNGFVDGVPKGKAYKLDIDQDVWLFRSDEDWDFRKYYNFYSAGIILTKLWVKYVHQLQHALRLAGVEKEIEV